MALTQSKENSKDNVPCKQISKVEVSQEEQNSKLQVTQEEQSSKVEVSQEEHAYRELTSLHANTRLQLEIGGIIGRGSFGTVHTARWRQCAVAWLWRGTRAFFELFSFSILRFLRGRGRRGRRGACVALAAHTWLHIYVYHCEDLE